MAVPEWPARLVRARDRWGGRPIARRRAVPPVPGRGLAPVTAFGYKGGKGRPVVLHRPGGPLMLDSTDPRRHARHLLEHLGTLAGKLAAGTPRPDPAPRSPDPARL